MAINISSLEKTEELGLKSKRKFDLRKSVGNDWQIYVLLAPAFIYILLFNYLPIYGIQIGFKNFIAVKGISGSPWVGFEHFKNFFSSYYWDRLLINTLLLNLYSLIFAFPIPILLALMLNQVGSEKYKSFVQTTIYAPHFISVVVLAGMLYIFLSPTNGVVNKIIEAFGGQPVFFLNEPGCFRSVYIISGIWQAAGWNTILYIAALSGIDPQL